MLTLSHHPSVYDVSLLGLSGCLKMAPLFNFYELIVALLYRCLGFHTEIPFGLMRYDLPLVFHSHQSMANANLISSD